MNLEEQLLFFLITILVIVTFFGCAGVPVGAVSWKQYPPAPAPATEVVVYKGDFAMGKGVLNAQGTWTMTGCIKGVANKNIGTAPTMEEAEATIQKSCGY